MMDQIRKDVELEQLRKEKEKYSQEMKKIEEKQKIEKKKKADYMLRYGNIFIKSNPSLLLL